jgi:hypothetical protein
MCGCMLIQRMFTIFAWQRWIVGGNMEIIVTADFYEVPVRFVLYLRAKTPSTDRYISSGLRK